MKVRAGKIALCPTSSLQVGGGARKAQANHPRPRRRGCCEHVPQNHTEAQKLGLLLVRDSFSSTPSVLQKEKLRLRRGGPWGSRSYQAAPAHLF